MGFDLEVSEILQEEFEKKVEKIRARIDSCKKKSCSMGTKKINSTHVSDFFDLLKQPPQFFSIAI